MMGIGIHPHTPTDFHNVIYIKYFIVCSFVRYFVLSHHSTHMWAWASLFYNCVVLNQNEIVSANGLVKVCVCLTNTFSTAHCVHYSKVPNSVQPITVNDGAPAFSTTITVYLLYFCNFNHRSKIYVCWYALRTCSLSVFLHLRRRFIWVHLIISREKTIYIHCEPKTAHAVSCEWFYSG